jgi:hypothetical protein
MKTIILIALCFAVAYSACAGTGITATTGITADMQVACMAADNGADPAKGCGVNYKANPAVCADGCASAADTAACTALNTAGNLMTCNFATNCNEIPCTEDGINTATSCNVCSVEAATGDTAGKACAPTTPI